MASSKVGRLVAPGGPVTEVEVGVLGLPEVVCGVEPLEGLVDPGGPGTGVIVEALGGPEVEVVGGSS